MARAVQSRPCEVQGRGSSGTDLPGLGPHQIRMFLEAQVPWPGQLWGKLEPPGGAKLQAGQREPLRNLQACAGEFCESCSGVTALSGLPGPTDCTGQGFLSHWSHELASAFPQTAVSGDQATSFLSLCPDRLYRASGQLVPGCLLS